MIGLSKAVTTAVHDSSAPMTRSLRRTAARSGWPGVAGRSLKVTSDGKHLKVEANDEAMGHEYGGTEKPPTATIRKWANHDAEDALIKAVAARMKGVL